MPDSRSGARLTIDSPAEYALYLLALTNPNAFADVERFSCRMLAEDQDAARRVKAVMAASGPPLARPDEHTPRGRNER